MAVGAEKSHLMQLNEYCVKNSYHPPEWTEVKRSGPSHLPVFVYQVSIRHGNQVVARTGEGTSKQQAKTEAAKAMMLGLRDPNSLPVASPGSKTTLAVQDAMPEATRPKKKPPCFHYKKILAHMKARRDGDDFEVLPAGDINPSFDSKEALAHIAPFWGFTCRYQTYKLDAESPVETPASVVLRVCIVSFQHAKPELLRHFQDKVIRPEVFCQGQGKTVEEADEECAGRALKYLACMNDKLDASA
ncbi:hypothetical protein RvY_15002 [Ramazzottius varieornatus]|uniref:DRBM domain-containing protein n=1 Tax=Ramazzottius varieornatus TaxID=947166 RepID=A0A1D1VV12_RAMVA|nr:hypothetical protein RvY_15002 [Ramazzottius varieornatus]